jgi:hypothetical protein
MQKGKFMHGTYAEAGEDLEHIMFSWDKSTGKYFEYADWRWRLNQYIVKSMNPYLPDDLKYLRTY